MCHLVNHVRCGPLKLIIAIHNSNWLHDAIDDLAKVAVLVLSYEVFLGGIIAVFMPTMKIWSKFDNSSIRLDGTVPVARICERRLLARDDSAAGGDTDMLWRAMVFD
jgi:hypothetical protein